MQRIRFETPRVGYCKTLTYSFTHVCPLLSAINWCLVTRLWSIINALKKWGSPVNGFFWSFSSSFRFLCVQVLAVAHQQRIVAATNVNKTSSRSRMLLCVKGDGTERVAGIKTFGQLSMLIWHRFYLFSVRISACLSCLIVIHFMIVLWLWEVFYIWYIYIFGKCLGI